MSTNIQIDVVLQRLQEQAKQVLDQNRSERQEREDQQRLSTDAQQRETREQRIARSQKEQSLAAQRAQAAEEQSGVPDPYKKRRPAAQRQDEGSTIGVQYTTQIISAFPASTFRLTVGIPGLAQKVVVDTLEPSGAAATNQPSSSDTTSGSESVLGFVTYSATPNFFGFNYTSQYPCGFTFQGGPGIPPTTSWTNLTIPRVTSDNYDDSGAYLLPIGKKAGIFVYVYSKLRVLTVYERISRVDRTSVNARVTSSGCGGQAGTYYDRESIFDLSETVYDVEQRQRYEIFAFVVNDTGVRQLEVPTALDAAIRSLHPPLEVNDTSTFLSSRVYTRFEFADVAGSSDEPANYNGPFVDGFSNVPVVNISKQRQESLHGAYQEVDARNAVLAKQFGLGYLNEEGHDGDFFSPAVYRFLEAPMNLSIDSAKNYAYMRSTYFSKAPRKYLAPCVLSTSCTEQESVGFDITSTAPVDIDAALPVTAFKREAKYDVALNGAYDYEVVFAWDWDNPTYCATKLKALGFTSADFKP